MPSITRRNTGDQQRQPGQVRLAIGMLIDSAAQAVSGHQLSQVQQGQSRQPRRRHSRRQAFGQVTSRYGQLTAFTQTQHGWEIPADQRQELSLGKAGTAQAINCLRQLAQDSQGGAVAALDFFAQHIPASGQEDYQARAQRQLIGLTRLARPSEESLRRAIQGWQESRSASNQKDRLIGELGYLEDQYLRVFFGMPSDLTVEDLSAHLGRVADGLEQEDSTDTQAFTRFMKADVDYVGMGDPHSANRQMEQAVKLTQQSYPDQIQAELAEAIGRNSVGKATSARERSRQHA